MSIFAAIARTFRGLSRGLRSHAGIAVLVASAVAVFNLAVPVAALSLLRKPVDFFTFNPWLPRLPGYLASDVPLGEKLAFLGNLKIAWASADGVNDLDWSFVLDTPTLLRIVATSAVFGAFFALLSYGSRAAAAKPVGALGAAASVFGLTTCPCTLAGSGAPVLPVLGLAFTGLPAATLNVFAMASRVGTALVLVSLFAAVLWLAWRAGSPQAC